MSQKQKARAIMKNIKEDAGFYILTGLLEHWEGDNLELIENMICDVKKDQVSIALDDPEKEYMDGIFNESLRLLQVVSNFCHK